MKWIEFGFGDGGLVYAVFVGMEVSTPHEAWKAQIAAILKLLDDIGWRTEKIKFKNLFQISLKP